MQRMLLLGNEFRSASHQNVEKEVSEILLPAWRKHCGYNGHPKTLLETGTLA